MGTDTMGWVVVAAKIENVAELFLSEKGMLPPVRFTVSR